MKCLHGITIFISVLILFLKLNCSKKVSNSLNIFPKYNPKFFTQFSNSNSKARETSNYDIGSTIKNFTIPMVQYYKRFAKFAYCHKKDIYSKRGLCPAILGSGWGINRVKNFIKIIYSKIYKKIIVACSYKPRRFFELPKKFIEKSKMIGFEKEKKAKIVKFFYSKYFWAKTFVFLQLKKLQKFYPEFQVLFVGHSFGGSICNLLAQGAVKKKILPKKKDSPVLITYGQPITGNKDFIKNSKKLIPHIFRILRKEDAMPTYPRDTNSKKTIPSSIYPKEIGDFIMINNETDEFTNCTSEVAKDNENCKVSTNFNTYNNKFYFNDNLADIDPNTEYNKVIIGVTSLY